MPQADEQLCARMIERFGSIDDSGPTRFLEAAGYVLTPEWLWVPKPGVATFSDMTREEFECLMFLVHEWDFGGFANDGRGKT